MLADGWIYAAENDPSYPGNATYLLPCTLASNQTEVMSLTFGGMAFGIQFQDIM